MLLAVVAIILAAASLYQSQTQVQAAAQWVDHTHHVIENLDELETSLATANDEADVFLLTGRAAHLRMYAAAREASVVHVADALDSTRDNPEQQARLASLQQHLQSVLHSLDTTVAASRAGHTAEALASPEFEVVEDAPTKLRGEVAGLRTAELQLLKHRAAEVRARVRQVRQRALAVLGVALVVVVASFRVVRRDAQRLASAVHAERVAQDALRESEARHRLLFERNPVPSWVHDAESLRFVAVNPAAVARYGFTEAEFLAMTLADLSPATDDEPSDPMRRHRTKDGRWMDVRLESHEFELDGRRASLVLAADVTAQRRAEARLHDLAMRDALTGLTNRRGFEELASRALAEAQQIGRPDALLYLDLDGFKPINDTHGHAEGDAALITVASVLRTAVRDGDVVARLGGDEFVVYVARTAQQCEGEAIAGRLRAALDASNARAAATGRPYALGVTIGVAELAPGDSLATLLARADASLYERKQGRERAA